VTTASGTHERRVTSVPGDPARPFGAAEVTAKFRRFVTPVIGEEQAANLLSTAAAVVAGDRSAADLLDAIPTAPATRPR
jgi:hypothetical protein